MTIVVKMIMNKAKKIYSKNEYKKMNKEALEYLNKLEIENKDIPKAMKKHTDLCIFPAIAVYNTLINHNMDKEDAVDLISNFFTKLSGNGFKLFSLWLHLFGNYHRYPANFVKNSFRDFSPEAGFKYKLPKEKNPAVAKFDIVQCPYHDMCKKYNCIELNRAFCDSDDAKYGCLHPKLMWKRSGTLGKGANCCDFLIVDTSRFKNEN